MCFYECILCIVAGEFFHPKKSPKRVVEFSLKAPRHYIQIRHPLHLRSIFWLIAGRMHFFPRSIFFIAREYYSVLDAEKSYYHDRIGKKDETGI